MLVGREGELGCIEELLGRARSGCGAVAVLEGPAGIGKTALLAEAARQAGDYGFSALRASGGELEREYAFGVVRQLFWPVVAPGRGRGDLFEGAAGLAARPLGLPDVQAVRAESRGDAASAGMHGLYWLTADLAERAPVLVAVDDAHWSDEMSLRFVLYLARRVADLPVLMLVAARPAAGPGDGGLLARLGALAGVAWLRPVPLREPEVGRLIAERGLRGADPRFVGACYHASGGNPFLVSELLVGLAANAVSGSADEAALVAGLAPQGIVRWVRIREAVELSADPRRRAGAYRALGRALLSAGDWAGAAEAFRRGLGELAGQDDELFLELRGWSITLGRDGSPAAAAAVLSARDQGDAPARTRIERLQLAQLAYESGISGAQPYQQVACLARRALAGGALLNDGATDTGPYSAACYALTYAGEPAAAAVELTRAIELSQRRGSPVGFGWFCLLRGMARYMRGELVEALADLDSARNTYGEGYEHGMPATLAFLALCLIERDDTAAAARAGVAGR